MKLSICLLAGALIVLPGCAEYTIPTFQPAESAPAVTSGFSDEAIPAWDEKYRSEPVVWLLSETRIHLNADCSYTEDSHFVLKIQGEAGKQAGVIPLPYNQSTDVVETIRGETVTPDGRRVPCTQIDEVSPYGTSGENRIKVLTMPEVTVGSVLDITTKVTHTKPTLEKNFFQIFTITSTRPVKIARFFLSTPAGLPLKFKNRNTTVVPEIADAAGRRTYTWEIKGREKILPEDDMPDVGEICEAVFMSTFPGWEALADQEASLFQKNMTASPELSAEAKRTTAPQKNRRDRIQAVIEYIQKEYRYVPAPLETGRYEPNPVSQVFAAKSGDSKDLTALAVTMLSELGIKAHPAFFTATLDFAFPERLPMPVYFNRVLLCVEEEDQISFTDILRKGFLFDEVPYDIANGYALVLNGRGGRLIRVAPADPATYTTASAFKVTLGPDGSALFNGSVTFPRMVSTKIRDEYLTAPAAEKAKWLSSLDESFAKGGLMQKRVFQDMAAPYKNVRVEVQYRRPEYAKLTGNTLAFGPGRISPPALTAASRKLPIVFIGNSLQDNTITFILPQGFSVARLPKDIHYNTEFMKLDRTYQAKGGTVMIKDVFEIKTVKMPAESYAGIKAFMDTLAAATGDMITLERKGRP